MSLKPLRKIALKHPDTEEGVACAGTPAERVTVRVGKRAFLFLGRKDIMLKLTDSIAEATRLAGDGVHVGSSGWTKIDFPDGQTPLPAKLIEKWIAESYRAMTTPAPAKPK